jgi:hypothetical protein
MSWCDLTTGKGGGLSEYEGYAAQLRPLSGRRHVRTRCLFVYGATAWLAERWRQVLGYRRHPEGVQGLPGYLWLDVPVANASPSTSHALSYRYPPHCHQLLAIPSGACEVTASVLTSRSTNVSSDKRAGAGQRWIAGQGIQTRSLRRWALFGAGVARFPSWTSPVRVRSPALWNLSASPSVAAGLVMSAASQPALCAPHLVMPTRPRGLTTGRGYDARRLVPRCAYGSVSNRACQNATRLRDGPHEFSHQRLSLCRFRVQAPHSPWALITSPTGAPGTSCGHPSANPYAPSTVWFKVKNRAYTQLEGRGDLFYPRGRGS